VPSGIGAAAGSARDRGHQDQLVDPLGMGERQLLGDHPAKAGADQAGTLDAGMVQDRQDVVGHHAGRVVPRRSVGGADATVVDGDDLESAGEPGGHRLPTPATNAYTLNQNQRRPTTAKVIGNGHRAVAGKAGRAHTGCARQAQPDSRTLPQPAAELAEWRCNCGPGPTRSAPDLGRPLPSTGSDHVAFPLVASGADGRQALGSSSWRPAWAAARRARGDADGTRALTEILLGHRTLPAAAPSGLPGRDPLRGDR